MDQVITEEQASELLASCPKAPTNKNIFPCDDFVDETKSGIHQLYELSQGNRVFLRASQKYCKSRNISVVKFVKLLTLNNKCLNVQVFSDTEKLDN